MFTARLRRDTVSTNEDGVNVNPYQFSAPMNKLAPISIIAASALTTSLWAATTDWPQWKGPQRNGICTETGLLKSWPKDGPQQLWSTTGIGVGYGTVAIAGETMVVQGDLEDASQVIALKLADGKQIWATKLGKGGAPGWGGFAGPRCTPTIDGNLVFAVGQFGQVGCFDLATGNRLWQKDFTTDFKGMQPEWGFSASPLVDGDKIVLTPGGPEGNIVALNKKTGELVWRSKAFTDNHHYASLISVEIGGKKQCLQLTEESVAGISLEDGALLWSTSRKGSTAVIPDPIYKAPYLYITSGYGAGCNLFKISETGGKISAEQVYANKIMINHHGGVALVGGYVYGFSDSKGWTCQNLVSGEAAWQENGKLGKGSILYADGHFILREEKKSKGAVGLIEATPTGYKETGRFTPPNQSGKDNWTHPVIHNGKLYLRDQNTLFCYIVK